MAWRHIAISGELGSGKSSVATALARKLGSAYLSTGSMQRGIAESLSLSTLEANRLAETDASIDDMIDSALAERGRSGQPTVFDSRLAWHFVPTALKVHLLVEPREGAARAMRRGPTTAEHYATLDAAEAAIHARFESERRRFVEKYGIDIARLRNYDVIVDTTYDGLEDVVATVRSAAQQVIERPALFLNSRRVEQRPGAFEIPIPRVVYARPWFASLGRVVPGSGLQRFALAAEEDELVEDGLSAREFVARAGILEKHRNPGGTT